MCNQNKEKELAIAKVIIAELIKNPVQSVIENAKEYLQDTEKYLKRTETDFTYF